MKGVPYRLRLNDPRQSNWCSFCSLEKKSCTQHTHMDSSEIQENLLTVVHILSAVCDDSVSMATAHLTLVTLNTRTCIGRHSAYYKYMEG